MENYYLKSFADQEKDVGDSVVKQTRSNTPNNSKLKQVRFITSDKVSMARQKKD